MQHFGVDVLRNTLKIPNVLEHMLEKHDNHDITTSTLHILIPEWSFWYINIFKHKLSEFHKFTT